MATKIGELRETLIGVIDDLRSGKMEPEAANAIAKVASALNANLQVEINARKLLLEGGKPKDFGQLPLGDEDDSSRLPAPGRHV